MDRFRRVLAVYPRTAGFAYAVVEGPKRLIDWGQVTLGKDTNAEFSERVEELIDRLECAVLVLEDCSNTRRGEKAQTRIEHSLRLAKFRDMGTALLSPGEVRGALGLLPKASKYAVAARVGELFPELMPWMPQNRIWQFDPRMYVFGAVALCLAFLRWHGQGPVA